MPRSVQAITSTPPGEASSGHAAVREIEAAAGQIEKHKIAVRSLGDKRGRRKARQTADKTGLKRCASVFIGDGFAENFIVARKQRQRYLAERFGGGERTQEHRQPVLSGKGRQANVGYHEPLGSARIPAFVLVTQRRAP
jgi:hypothetical protein